MSSSPALLFMNKSYGQYISALETELQKGGLQPLQQITLHTNIAFAQLELGLNRKATKSAQTAIDLAGDHLAGGSVPCRAYIIKGKALNASGKSEGAMQVWKDGLASCLKLAHLVDAGLLSELCSLVNSADSSSVGGNPSVPTASAIATPQPPIDPVAAADGTRAADVTAPTTRPLDTASTQGMEGLPPPAAITKTETKAPVKSTGSSVATTTQPPSTKEIPASAPTEKGKLNDAAGEAQPPTARVPQPQPKQQPQSNATQKPAPQTQPPQQTGPATAAKEAHRQALVAIHQQSLGDGPNKIKPIYLNGIRRNLPHVCGEALVDDLVCLAYVQVNTGNLDLAKSILQAIKDYRTDVPAALIGSGSIAAMQSDFDLAIKEFSAALVIDDKVADAWKRRGQTRAAKGQVQTALKDLTRAIALEPNDGDNYNQRGLIHHQVRNYTGALADFRAAAARGVETAPLWNYVGMCEGQLGNVPASLVAHEKALRLQPTFKEAQLNIALMHKEVGDWSAAEGAFAKAITCGDAAQTFFQAYAHRGVMRMQMGRPALAIKDFTVAINCLFTIVKGTTPAPAEERVTRRNELVQNLIRTGVCYQSVGQFNKTIGYFDQAVSLAPTSACLFQREIALFLWAHLDIDLALYNLDDRVDPRLKDGWCKHADWAEYMGPHLATPASAASTAGTRGATGSAAGASQANTDGLAPYVLYTKPIHVSCTTRYTSLQPDDDGLLLPTEESTGKAGTAGTAGSTTTELKPVQNEEQKLRLLALSAPFASLIQLDSPGFLPNRRQHRMFGLAVLQMSTALCRHFSLLSHESAGLVMADAASSRDRSSHSSGAAGGGSRANRVVTSPGAEHDARKKVLGGAGGVSALKRDESFSRSGSPSGKRGAGAATHIFNWRDLYDIAVRWRQASEPGDPVWWIDRLPTRAFKEGFGLQTPLVNGHLRTVRYAPYYQLAFERVKDCLKLHGYYSTGDVHYHLSSWTKVTAATDLRELHAAVGCDFFVVGPCPSLSSPGLLHEGSRLTLLAQEPEGFDFTIRTPGKPYRWGLYDEELTACFHRLEEAFLVYSDERRRSEEAERRTATDRDPDSDGASAQQLQSDDSVLRSALELFYWWATFAPLSRGTAACGYAALCAVLLVFDKQLASPSLLPAGKQLDWEAILAADFESFFTKVKGWFRLTDAAPELLEAVRHPWVVPAGTEAEVQGEGVGPEPAVDCIRTLRDMLDTLCLPYEK